MRRLGYLLLATCFCLPIAGCGGDAAPTATDTPPTSEESSDSAGSGTSEEASEAPAGSGAAE
ncbi:MAG: hypothetical protein AAGD11_16145 [Planctomycetota bacterium]